MPRKSNENGNSTNRTKKSTKITEATPAIAVVSENRKVVVPINLEDEIRRRAYELYVQRGNTPGNEHEDWLTAEREVRSRYEAAQTA